MTVAQKVAATSTLLLVISTLLAFGCKREPTYGADSHWKIFVGLLMIVSFIVLIGSVIAIIWSAP